MCGRRELDIRTTRWGRHKSGASSSNTNLATREAGNRRESFRRQAEGVNLDVACVSCAVELNATNCYYFVRVVKGFWRAKKIAQLCGSPAKSHAAGKSCGTRIATLSRDGVMTPRKTSVTCCVPGSDTATQFIEPSFLLRSFATLRPASRRMARGCRRRLRGNVPALKTDNFHVDDGLDLTPNTDRSRLLTPRREELRIAGLPRLDVRPDLSSGQHARAKWCSSWCRHGTTGART